MKFLKSLFGGKSDTAVSAPAPAPKPAAAPAPEAPVMARPDVPSANDTATLKAVSASVTSADKAASDAVNIWDMDDDDDVAVDAPVKNRRRRNATRLIGFEHSDDAVVDLFEGKATAADQSMMQFPVGWLLVMEGEGRGYAFGITTGLNQVGRGEENSIQLDFGDSSISRKNHFAVVYDEEERKFILGHGGKSNIVRLNGKAVIANEDLKDGDTIKVGATVLQLKTLCGPDFTWVQDSAADEDEEGQDDVAIA